MLLFFCFFKQKTAYELRISDWSSDVCSSDLASNANPTLSEYFAGGDYTPRPGIATLANAMDVGAPSNFERLRALYANDAALRADLSAEQIGRASCWERGCQDV